MSTKSLARQRIRSPIEIRHCRACGVPLFVDFALGKGDFSEFCSVECEEEWLEPMERNKSYVT